MHSFVFVCLFFMWINTCCSQTSAENIETQYEERNSTGSGLQTLYSTHRPSGPLRPPLHLLFPSAKSEVLGRDQKKKTQSFKMEDLPGPLITDQQNFSLETKQEPEYVSTTTNVFVSSMHTGGMFSSSPTVFWCFFSPCGWWNVLGSDADSWQASWAGERHGSERVRWPCGWPRSGGCLATRRPRAGCTESQRMMDWPMWVPVGKPSCYFDLLFGQRSEHTLVMGFDWLLWLVTGVFGFEEKPFLASSLSSLNSLYPLSFV